MRLLKYALWSSFILLLVNMTAGFYVAVAQQTSKQKSIGNRAPSNLAQEIERVNAEIDRTFANTLAKVAKIPNDKSHQMERLQALGDLLLNDRQLSVNRNTACVSCHMPYTGFTGPISEINRTTVSYPGSVRSANADPAHSRYGGRKPQSYSYAPYSQVLHYNPTQQDFYAGNFWDMRATGWKLQNPSSEQAQGPFMDPDEQGFIDSACVVYRVSKSPYRQFFESIWGPQSFEIKWPADIEEVCSRPGPPSKDDPFPVHLSPEDRGRSNATYDQIGMAIAANEASPDVSPFSSKFDYALAHPDKKVLTKDELAGWQLFRTKGKCNQCHLDGTSDIKGPITPKKATNLAPLFTDFTAVNIGIPKNPAIPFYHDTKPDQYGYVANPEGLSYKDLGVGGFLRGKKGPIPNGRWASLASRFDGKFQTATLRNVDLRPYPAFVKAYGHNGYFKSLKEIVHFYNTRDKFPHCSPGARGEKITCWPPPEVSANENKQIGNLGLTNKEENQIVAFLKTLNDGYVPPKLR